MSTEIQIFSYQEKQVRTIQRDGETWWVLKDVCEILEIKNHKDVTNRLDEDEVDLSDLTDALGRKQKTNIINEAGLYNVILRSDKPQAKEFKRWVTHDVLPLIRKTGSYSVKSTLRQPRLSEINSMARTYANTAKAAGMKPQFIMVAVQRIYAAAGFELPIEGVTVDRHFFDATAIAEKLGIHSNTGNPHNQAIAAIIAQLDIDDDEKQIVPFQNQSSGHAGTNYQYAESVIVKIAYWLKDHDYPVNISYNNKSYKVTYNTPKAHQLLSVSAK